MTAPSTNATPSTRHLLRRLLGALLGVTGGVLAAVAFATLLLLLFAEVLLGPVDFYTRATPNQQMQVDYHLLDGDLFAAMEGRVRPPADNPVLAQIDIAWDAQGFRVPARSADHYPLLAFGDSFTESAITTTPWPDALAAALDLPVRNYGYRAYGPREIARVAEETAPQHADSPPDWVIWAHFSGNDLGDTDAERSRYDRTLVGVWTELFDNLTPTVIPAHDSPAHFDFPMPVIIGGNYYDMAFLSYYLAWMLEPEGGYADSQPYQTLRESLTRAAAAYPDSCRLLVYLPTKEQLYYPYIHPDARQWMRGIAQQPVVEAGTGDIWLRNTPVSAEDEATFIDSMTGQRDMLAALADSLGGWHFLDLTPTFAEAVARGELVYLRYDTHWNQAGHDLAAAQIAAFLQDSGLRCTARQNGS